jgi:hypothetical protein
MIELNPLLVEIEPEITRLNPEVKRVSSGRSGLTDRLTGMLWAKPGFEDVVYLEARHVATQTAEQYLGASRSVNDLRVRGGGFVYQISGFRRAQNRQPRANRNDVSDASLGSTAGVGYPGNGFLLNLEWRPVSCTLRP